MAVQEYGDGFLLSEVPIGDGFLDGFLRNRDAFQLDLPLVPLGELYGTRLESWRRSA
jgi:hypothetical protein